MVRPRRRARLAAFSRWKSASRRRIVARHALERGGVDAQEGARRLGDDAGGARHPGIEADLSDQRAGQAVRDRHRRRPSTMTSTRRAPDCRTSRLSDAAPCAMTSAPAGTETERK